MSRRSRNGIRAALRRLDAVTRRNKVDLTLLGQLQASSTKQKEVKQTNEGEKK
jgi:hypothetical protein